MPYMRDGTWSLSVERQVEGTRLAAFARVELAGRDSERLQVRLSPPFNVPVRIVHNPPEARPSAGQAVLLAPPGGGPAPHSIVDRDGAMTVVNVYPGLYRVMPIAPLSQYYVASVTLGGRDVFGQFVDFEPGAPAIEVVYKNDGGTVRGTVENCGRAVVTLVPQADALRQPELVYSGQCSEAGRFEIGNIRPGDYYAFAFSRQLMAVDLLPALGIYLNRAARVEVNSGQTASLDLKVTGVE
jgi:hypothetical protein